jgi:hypothetical protein
MEDSTKRLVTHETIAADNDRLAKQKYYDILLRHNVSSNLLDLTKDVAEPPVALALKNTRNDKFATIGSLGDFSLWTGKAKVGKSYVMRMAVVAALKDGEHLSRWKSDLPKNKSVVMVIDTEQSDYHLSLAAKRICYDLKVSEPEDLLVYGFRGTASSDLKDIVEALIYTTKNLGIVIVDGIVDLIGDIMNQELGQAASVMVGRWTKDNNIHVACVLHENKSKSDDNARGAIGTYLTQKAETVMNVSNCPEDKSLKLVKAIETRNSPPDDFYFRINENGNAEEADAPVRENSRQKAINGESLAESLQVEIVKSVWSEPLNAQNSIDCLQDFLKSNDYNVLTGVIAIKRYLNYLVTHNYLTKAKGDGAEGKATFYQLTKRVKAMKIAAPTHVIKSTTFTMASIKQAKNKSLTLTENSTDAEIDAYMDAAAAELGLGKK